MDAKENNSGDEQQPKQLEVIVKGLSFDATESDVTQFFKGLCQISSINLVTNKKDQSKNNKGYCFLKFDAQEEFEKALAQDGAEFMGRNLKIEEGKKKQQDEDSLAVFVGNLSFNLTTEAFREEFINCGGKDCIENARVITDHSTGKSKGFGIVDFKDQKGVQDALNLNGNIVDGREMRIKISSNAPRPYSSRGRGGRGFNGGRGGGGYRGDRGGGGYRGDRGGGFRGDRGGYRGDGGYRGGQSDRGGYRGNSDERQEGGGYRGGGGGYRGDRGGGYRGGEGGYRGGGGEGGYRGDRGGYRGGDRGGDRGGRGGDRPPRRGGRRGGYGDNDSDN